jgi:hypothetical protein
VTSAQLTSILNAINAGISQMQIGNAVVGGVATRVLYVGAGPVLAQSTDFTWTDSTHTLTLGGGTPNNAVISGGNGKSLTVTTVGNFGTIVLTSPGGSGITIAASASELLSFYGVAAVTQRTAAGVTTGYTAGASTAVTIDGTFTGNVGATAYTIGDLVAALKALGFIQA